MGYCLCHDVFGSRHARLQLPPHFEVWPANDHQDCNVQELSSASVAPALHVEVELQYSTVENHSEAKPMKAVQERGCQHTSKQSSTSAI